MGLGIFFHALQRHPFPWGLSLGLAWIPWFLKAPPVLDTAMIKGGDWVVFKKGPSASSRGPCRGLSSSGRVVVEASWNAEWKLLSGWSLFKSSHPDGRVAARVQVSQCLGGVV